MPPSLFISLHNFFFFLRTGADWRREARGDSHNDCVVVLQMHLDRELPWQFWFEMFYASQSVPLHTERLDLFPLKSPLGTENVNTATIAKAEKYPIFTVIVA